MKKALPDFKVRLPQSLKDEIEAAARKNNRSMNGEIVAVLEAFYAAGGVTHASGFDMPPTADSELEKRVTALERAMSAITTNDRSYDHEIRISRLESKV